MELIQDRRKRNSAITVIALHLLLLILFLFFGPQSEVPPPNRNIKLAGLEFGNNSNGAKGGDVKKGEPETNSTPTQPQEPQVEAAAPTTTKKLVTDESVVAVEDGNAVKKPSAEELEEQRLRDEEERRKAAEAEEKARIEKERQDKLDKLNKNLTGAWSGGNGNHSSDGDGTGSGDKGDPFGKGGTNGNPFEVGPGLTGRSAAFIPKSNYDSPEEGTVIVKIIVDRSGKVISATPGVNWNELKTTTGNPNLRKEAKRLALEYKWSPNSEAPPQQVGFVSFTFTKGR